MNEEALKKLRAPFPENQISLLPKPTKRDAPKGKCNECGGWHGLPAVHLSYVGHAALTDRLLDADPAWSWEPLAMSPDGLPVMDPYGGMWIKLTVAGVTRLGYGHAGDKSGGDAIKEIIGDALRNAAMRFGAALDLWHKGELHAHTDEDTRHPPERAPEFPDAAPGEGDIVGFSRAHAATIRKTAAAAIQHFNEGADWSAYEEVMSCVDKIGGSDESERNKVKLALSSIFHPHSALRSSLKRMAEEERQREVKTPAINGAHA